MSQKYKWLTDVVDKMSEEEPDFLKEGQKVKLKYDYIKSRTNYLTKTKEYKDFIENNKDKTFTVEYDSNHKNKPNLVCLKEDTTVPKWLFWSEFLEVVE